MSVKLGDRKVAGPDGLTAEHIKNGGGVLQLQLSILFLIIGITTNSLKGSGNTCMPYHSTEQMQMSQTR